MVRDRIQNSIPHFQGIQIGSLSKAKVYIKDGMEAFKN